MRSPSSANQQKQSVTFSVQNMEAFSHEELQHVILKYDSEYKKLKKQAIGNILIVLNVLDNA
jgi:hypothetical protein